MTTHEKTARRMLGIFGLGQDRVGWDGNTGDWDDDYRWCLYIGFILLFYCTLALCCICAGRCSKGGRNREVLINEQFQTIDQRKRRVKRRPASYAVVEEEVIEEPVVNIYLISHRFNLNLGTHSSRRACDHPPTSIQH